MECSHPRPEGVPIVSALWVAFGAEGDAMKCTHPRNRVFSVKVYHTGYGWHYVTRCEGCGTYNV